MHVAHLIHCLKMLPYVTFRVLVRIVFLHSLCRSLSYLDKVDRLIYPLSKGPKGVGPKKTFLVSGFQMTCKHFIDRIAKIPFFLKIWFVLMIVLNLNLWVLSIHWPDRSDQNSSLCNGRFGSSFWKIWRKWISIKIDLNFRIKSHGFQNDSEYRCLF